MEKQKKKDNQKPVSRFGVRFMGAYLAAVGLILAVLLGYDLIRGWRLLFPPAVASSSNSVRTTDTNQEQKKFARRLDGFEVNSLLEADQAPVGVMIENSIEARPQSGLSKAKVVYETLAEGGVTRFLAMFLPTEDISKIGPVRSVRHYYLDWAEEYGGAFAHAGGSPLGLSQITRDRVPDLNGIGNAWRYFYRDSSVPAPHNLFTNSKQLTAALADLRYPTDAQFQPWEYSSVSPVGQSGATVTVGFSGRAYSVRYDYDEATKQYKRYNANVEAIDRSTGKQIMVDNVVVQTVARPRLLAEKGRIDLETIGTGKVVVFRNGIAIEGMWSKKDTHSRTTFQTADGQPIALHPGITWVEVTPADQQVTYR